MYHFLNSQKVNNYTLILHLIVKFEQFSGIEKILLDINNINLDTYL